jgi:predicted secreted protein
MRTVMFLSLALGVIGGCGETRPEPKKGYSDGVIDGNSSSGDQNGGGGEEFSGVEVVVGERHIFDLESNPSTGFSWVVQDFDATILKLVSQIYLAPEQEIPGAQGNDRFTFEGLDAGQVTITIDYKQLWDIETLPAQIHEVEIRVTE